MVGVTPVKSARRVALSPAFTVMLSPFDSPVAGKVNAMACVPGSTEAFVGAEPRETPSTVTVVPSPRSVRVAFSAATEAVGVGAGGGDGVGVGVGVADGVGIGGGACERVGLAVAAADAVAGGVAVVVELTPRPR